MLLDPLVEFAFDLQVFNHGLDDQIVILQLSKIIFEVSDSNQRSEVGREECRRLGFPGCFQPGASNAVAHFF